LRLYESTGDRSRVGRPARTLGSAPGHSLLLGRGRTSPIPLCSGAARSRAGSGWRLLLQNDSQPPGWGRLRALRQGKLQMVYRHEGKCHADCRRTFVGPGAGGVYADGWESAPAPGGVRPGVWRRESRSPWRKRHVIPTRERVRGNRAMPSDFAPVRSILAREREQGRPFPEAWKVALEAVEDRERRQVLRATRKAWRDGYERRESKIRALAADV